MRHASAQRGATVITVITLLLLLAVIAVGGAFRLGRLAETLVGSSADHARARAAADALMRDAETDILGSLPSYNVTQADGMRGYPCRPSAGSPMVSLAGFTGCRNTGVASNPWFPYNWDEYQRVVDLVTAANAPGCSQAICRPQATPIEDNLATMTALGAQYGQHTRSGMAAPGVSGNPILTGAAASGWYWIEVFQYVSGAVAPQGLALPTKGFVPLYRITVVAQGVRPGTRVVLKSWFSPAASTP